MKNLYKELSTLRKNHYDLRDFYCEGMTTIAPLMKMKDFEIAYPCTDVICENLKKLCVQSPVGIGEKTVIDEEIRKGKELSSEITIQISKTFQNYVNHQILRSIKKHMAPEKDIHVEFYKLLLYEEGDFFKAHKDGQKGKSHFGSLLVFLPSYYEGGDFLLRHQGVEKKYNFSLSTENDNLEFHWLAFYSDCEHEIKPITKGKRVVMTYNVYSDKNHILEIPDTKVVKEVQECVDSIFNHPDFKKKTLGILLDHNYSQMTLDFDHLKGRDFDLHQMMKYLDGYDLFMEKIEIKCSFLPDHGFGADGPADGLENEFRYGIKGHDDVGFVNFEKVRNAVRGRVDKPDKCDIGPTGNEGVDIELQYVHACIFITPRSKRKNEEEEEESSKKLKKSEGE